MDFQSISQYIGKQIFLTLKNKFWYKAKILSVSEDAVVFIELKGRKISVSPDQIIMIEEVKDGSY